MISTNQTKTSIVYIKVYNLKYPSKNNLYSKCLHWIFIKFRPYMFEICVEKFSHYNFLDLNCPNNAGQQMPTALEYYQQITF